MRFSILVFVGFGICWLSVAVGTANAKDKHKHHAKKEADDGFTPALPPHDMWTVRTSVVTPYTVSRGKIDVSGGSGGISLNGGTTTENRTSVKYGFQQVKAAFVSYEGNDVSLKLKFEEKVGKKTITHEAPMTCRPSALGDDDQTWLSRMKRLRNKTTWTLAAGGKAPDGMLTGDND